MRKSSGRGRGERGAGCQDHRSSRCWQISSSASQRRPSHLIFCRQDRFPLIKGKHATGIADAKHLGRAGASEPRTLGRGSRAGGTGTRGTGHGRSWLAGSRGRQGGRLGVQGAWASRLQGKAQGLGRHEGTARGLGPGAGSWQSNATQWKPAFLSRERPQMARMEAPPRRGNITMGRGGFFSNKQINRARR